VRHFIAFVVVIFGLLTAFYYRKDDKSKSAEDKKVHVYASSSFIAKWGPGPALKELFEKQNIFKVEYIESTDTGMTMQKINFEGDNSLADVVLGLDQFDLSRLTGKVKWKEIERSTGIKYVKAVEEVANEKTFITYDWAPLSFVARKSLKVNINSLKDLMNPDLKGKIALEDPRTSSPGLQFLTWIFETKSSEEAVKYLKAMMKQAHSFSPSWSAAYGLFKNGQADLVFSYVTSPVYHQVEEKDDQFLSVETSEALPAQVEFGGIPASCKNCEAAELFLNFLLTPEAQKIIMSKNYMLPVIDRVKEATPFDAIKIYKTLPVKFYDQSKLEKWLSTWSEIRKNEGN
jgi:thiamine transport system substrate-binding protein